LETYYTILNVIRNVYEIYENKIDWEYVSQYQTLFEGFMVKYEDKINWECISAFRTLSEKFTENHKNKIDKNLIMKNYRLSKILYINIKLNDELINITKFKDVKIFFL
jgi:hypothetical protein